MKILIWLDDYRNPFELLPNGSNWLVFSPLQQPYEVIWVKTYNEFIENITKFGLPNGICFDHDLADTHYTPEHLWNDYDKSKEWQEQQVHKEKTGFDCAKWLVNYCIDNNKILPLWNCQSANPVGRDNINGLLNNFKEKHESQRI